MNIPATEKSYTKLGKENAQEVIKLYDAGISMKELADRFEHTTESIKKVIKGDTYKQLHRPWEDQQADTGSVMDIKLLIDDKVVILDEQGIKIEFGVGDTTNDIRIHWNAMTHIMKIASSLDLV